MRNHLPDPDGAIAARQAADEAAAEQAELAWREEMWAASHRERERCNAAHAARRAAVEARAPAWLALLLPALEAELAARDAAAARLTASSGAVGYVLAAKVMPLLLGPGEQAARGELDRVVRGLLSSGELPALGDAPPERLADLQRLLLREPGAVALPAPRLAATLRKVLRRAAAAGRAGRVVPVCVAPRRPAAVRGARARGHLGGGGALHRGGGRGGGGAGGAGGRGRSGGGGAADAGASGGGGAGGGGAGGVLRRAAAGGRAAAARKARAAVTRATGPAPRAGSNSQTG